MSLEIVTSEEFHWRNSMRPVRFFAFDAKVVIFVALFLLHTRWWTLWLFIIAMILFSVLERRGLLFDSAIRAMRAWLYGKTRPGWLWFRKRKIVDYGGY
jgi:intracellular multiplication protein IcmT